MKHVIAVVLLLTLFGCKKDKTDQDRLKDDIKGTWQIANIKTVYYDSKGTVLLESSRDAPGTLLVTDKDVKITLSGREVKAGYTLAVSGSDKVVLINEANDYLAFKANNGIFITEQTNNNMKWESTLYNVTYSDPNTNESVVAAQAKVWHTFKR